jgi:PAS domain S-box-containing protein
MKSWSPDVLDNPVLLRSLLAGLQEALVVADPQGIVRLWNPAAERLFGFTAEEAQGRALDDLIVPERFRPAHDAGFARAVATGTLRTGARVLRTPGGFLEAAAMEKVEEFGWSSRYTCPLVDCPNLLKPTISRVRVRAHFVYRVPLAPEWTLSLAGDHYALLVPQPQLQLPVAFHTDDMQILTTETSWLSPPVAPNREALIRQLGPELARRGAEAAYVQAQRPAAEKTIQEFARKWMLQQGHPTDLPIQVQFQPVRAVGL